MFDWLLGRERNRTTLEQCCPFLGVVGLLLAIAVAVSGGPWGGLAVAIVGGALFAYGAWSARGFDRAGPIGRRPHRRRPVSRPI